MVSGKRVRIERITRNGKMLCIPMDHSITIGPVKGLDDVESTIEKVARGGATALLFHKGTLMHLREFYNTGIIIHLNASTSIGPSPNRKVKITSVEEAIRLGADAVSVHVNVGSNEEPEMLTFLGEVADKCDEYQVPLIAMMYPRGERIKEPASEEVISHAARIGSEAGADIVKTIYTGSIDSFSRVVRACNCPVVLAGGPKLDTDESVLQLASDAMRAGAIGVAFGRNVFQHKDPERITAAIKKVVIDGLPPEEALDVLRV